MHRLREDFLSERGELLVDDTWAAELARGLAPREDDIRVVKRGASAFAFTPLHRVLRNLKVRRCVLAGGAVTGCLASSAREGAALGYEIAIAEDATYPARAPYLDVLRDYVDIRPSAWFIGEGFGLPGRGD
jgi:nicotinamidase-related amidase